VKQGRVSHAAMVYFITVIMYFKVRVFTYLVGRENGSPFEAIKWIACNNKGKHNKILFSDATLSVYPHRAS
jgi:hypothetical protein